MADNVELQGIEFQIVGESKDAVQGVKSLASSLRKLQSVSEKGLGLSGIAKELKDFSTSVGDKNYAGLATMASALSEIANASRKMGNVYDKLKGVSELDFSNLEGAAAKITAIADAAGWSRGKGSSGKTIPAAPSADVPTDALDTETVEGTTGKMDAVGVAADDAANKGQRLRQVLVILGANFAKASAQVGKFAVKLTTLPIKRLAAAFQSTINPIRNFIASLGRIAMYRAVRTILSGITAALREGIANLYEYSRVANTDFHRSMDLMATDALWLKNSLASVVAPIINAIMPALDARASKIAYVLNLVAQLMAALTGKATYSRAIKSAKQYGDTTAKSAKSAAKAVRMLIAGFDELNAFPDKSDGGGGAGGGAGGFGSMFEEAPVSKAISDFAKQLRAAFEAGDWELLGKLLGDKVNEAFASVDWRQIGRNLGYKIDAVIRTAYSFLKTVNFNAIGRDVANIFNGIFETVHFDIAGRLLVRRITAMLDFVIGFIQGLDWDLAAKAIGDFFMGAFQEASEWLASQDFKQIAKTLSNGIIKILDAILEAVRAMDWEAVGRAIGEFLGNIDWVGIFTRLAEIMWTAFVGVMKGLLSTHGGRMFLLLFTLFKGLSLAVTLSQGFFSAAVQRWIMTGVTPLESATSIFGELGAAIPGSLILGIVGAAAGITVAVLGIKDAIMNGLTGLNAAVIPAGTALAGAGIGAIIGSLGGPIGAGIGALIGLAIGLITDGILLIKEHWNEISAWFSEAWAGFQATTSEVWTSITTTVTTSVSNAKAFVIQGLSEMGAAMIEKWMMLRAKTQETWMSIKTNVTTMAASMKASSQATLNAMKQHISTTWQSARTLTQTAWTQMSTTARQKFQEIRQTVITKMNECTSHLRSISWVSIASNLVGGFLSGLRSRWQSVVSWAQSAAAALTNTLRRAMRIHSPSKEWAEIGMYLDMGLESGLNQGMDRVVETARKMATTLTTEATPELPSIAALAATMLPGTDASQFASGSYGATAEETGGATRVLEQIYQFMQTADWGQGDRQIIIDGREVFDTVVAENNRAIQRTGISPIRV